MSSRSSVKKISTPFRFDLITLFPEECLRYGRVSLLGRGQDAGLIRINAVNPRDFTFDKHKTVDASPFGGGPGMVMMIAPIHRAIHSLRLTAKRKRTRVILLSARGVKFNRFHARRLASDYDRLVFVCGRYEGVDERVAEALADEQISIGDYVLLGGELPALTIIEAVSRFVPGFLHSKQSLEEERGGLYPVYTKPRLYKVKKASYDVPAVLTSGHAGRIAAWRKDHGFPLDSDL